MLANRVFWWLMLFYTHLLLLLQPSVQWLYIVTFNNDAKLVPKLILREFNIANPTSARWVTPPWNVYMAKFDPGWEGYPIWQTWLSALVGHPTYHVNVIKLKWEIIWTGRLPLLKRVTSSPTWGAPPSCKQALSSKMWKLIQNWTSLTKIASKSIVLIAVDNNSTLPFILDIFHITVKYLECAPADGSYVCTCKNWSGGDRSVV